MKFAQITSLLLAAGGVFGVSVKRQNGKPGFGEGQPIDGNGKGAPLLGMKICNAITPINAFVLYSY